MKILNVLVKFWDLFNLTPPTVHTKIFLPPPDRKIDFCSPQWGWQTKVKTILFDLTLPPPYDIKVWGGQSLVKTIMKFLTLAPPTKNVWELHTFEIFFFENVQNFWKFETLKFATPTQKMYANWHTLQSVGVSNFFKKNSLLTLPPPKFDVWEMPYIFLKNIRNMGGAKSSVLYRYSFNFTHPQS